MWISIKLLLMVRKLSVKVWPIAGVTSGHYFWTGHIIRGVLAAWCMGIMLSGASAGAKKESDCFLNTTFDSMICFDKLGRKASSDLDAANKKLMTQISQEGQAAFRKVDALWHEYMMAHCKFNMMGMEDASLHNPLLLQC